MHNLEVHEWAGKVMRIPIHLGSLVEALTNYTAFHGSPPTTSSFL